MQDELTLKELITSLGEYWTYFIKKWYWFVIAGVVVSAIFLYNAYTEPPFFTAPLTFMLNEDNDAAAGAGAILGSLGLGGQTKDGGDTEGKLIELARSRRVIGEILFDTVTIDSQSKVLADHIIDIYDYHEKWEEFDAMRGFYFGDNKPGQGNPVVNGVFKSLMFLLTSEQDGLLTLGTITGTGIFKISASTLNSELSVTLVNSIYEELSEYFVSSSVEGKVSTLQQLVIRADSVKNELLLAENRLARFQDRNSNVLFRQNSIKEQELGRQVAILNTMYGEIVKNRETSAFLLANEKPAFSLIDAPLSPLAPEKDSWKKAAVIGAFLGGFLAALVLFFNKMIRDAMAS